MYVTGFSVLNGCIVKEGASPGQSRQGLTTGFGPLTKIGMRELTYDEALDFFAVLYRGKHRLPSSIISEGPGVFGLSHYCGHLGMPTYDDDILTRLVFLAHTRCIRAWVQPSRPRCVGLRIQARDPSSKSISSGHPTLGQAIHKFSVDDEMSWSSWLTQKGQEVDAVTLLRQQLDAAHMHGKMIAQAADRMRAHEKTQDELLRKAWKDLESSKSRERALQEQLDKLNE